MATELNITNDDVIELKVDGKASVISKVEWGQIIGNISEQEDLQNILDGFVHLTGNEDIKGEKTFEKVVINGKPVLAVGYFGADSADHFVITCDMLTGLRSNGKYYELQFPGKDGTIAIVEDLQTKEDTSNKTTSLSSSSTNVQYPSAKAVYDALSTKVNNTQSTAMANRLYTVGANGKARLSKLEAGDGLKLEIIQNTSSTPSSYIFSLDETRGYIKVGNTVITEQQLQALLNLIS